MVGLEGLKEEQQEKQQYEYEQLHGKALRGQQQQQDVYRQCCSGASLIMDMEHEVMIVGLYDDITKHAGGGGYWVSGLLEAGVWYGCVVCGFLLSLVTCLLLLMPQRFRAMASLQSFSCVLQVSLLEKRALLVSWRQGSCDQATITVAVALVGQLVGRRMVADVAHGNHKWVP